MLHHLDNNPFCCQFFDIFALSFLTSAFCVHRPNQPSSEILCLGLRQFPFWSVLTITFDSSWSNFLLLSQLSLPPELKHCVPFFSTCCLLPRVSPRITHLLLALLFLFTGSRVPSLAVSLFSRESQRCPRRCSGPCRTNNLLKTLDVKGSQYRTLRRALCLRKHKLHLVTRLVDIHT